MSKTFKVNDISEASALIPTDGTIYKVLECKGAIKKLWYAHHSKKTGFTLYDKIRDIMVPISAAKIDRDRQEIANKIKAKRFKDLRRVTVDFLDDLCPDFAKFREMIDMDMIETPTEVEYKSYTESKSDSAGSDKENREEEQEPGRSTKHVKLWNIQADPNMKCRVIKGFMQSKKTWIMVATALYYYIVYRIPVFIVIENKIDACEQMLARIKQIFARYMDRIDKRDARENFETFFKFLDVKRGKTVSDDQFRDAMSGKRPRIFVALRSEYDLKPVNDIIDEKVTKRYALIIDESDAIDTNSDSKAQLELNRLKDNASLIWGVSATVLTPLMKEDIDCGNVFVMRRPENYKDLTTFNFRKLERPAEYCDSVDDKPFEKDQNLKGYISDFAKTKPYMVSIWGGQKHPAVSLVRVGTTIEPQLKVAAYVAEKYGNRITTITYNGTGLTLRGKNLPKEPIVLPDGSRSDYSESIHTFADCQIGTALAYLQENGGTAMFPRIMIMAGKMADRGITFGSSHYAECMAKHQVPWHLTEMYYLAAKGTDQPNLLQACGRLCGIYVDNIPLTIYSNACDDIVKAYHAQEELIERAREMASIAVGRLMKDLIPNVPMTRDKCARRRFTAPKVSCRLKRVKDDSNDGGWDWEAEGRTLDSTSAQFGDGSRPAKVRKVLTEEEIKAIRTESKEKSLQTREGFEKLKNAYERGSRKVRKIIDAFVEAEFEALSHNRLKKVCDGGFQYDNYDHWDLVRGKYHILDRTKSGLFNIRLDVVEYLGLM